jgi:hypothetical protein
LLVNIIMDNGLCCCKGGETSFEQEQQRLSLEEAASLQDKNSEIDSQTSDTQTETENGSMAATAAAKAIKYKDSQQQQHDENECDKNDEDALLWNDVTHIVAQLELETGIAPKRQIMKGHHHKRSLIIKMRRSPQTEAKGNHAHNHEKIIPIRKIVSRIAKS